MRATVNGAEIFFDVEGSGLVARGLEMVEKEACFILHGGPGMDHTYFKPWLTPLSDDMQLIYVDHRNTGRSARIPHESCTIEQMADDLEALRQMLGLGKVNVLGNSFGGFWAMYYAMRHPESINKLVLVSTAPDTGFSEAAAAELARKGNDAQKVAGQKFFDESTTNEEFAAWWEVMISLYFANYDEQIGAEMMARGIPHAACAGWMFQNVIPAYNAMPHLPNFSMPTLVLAGREDWVTPVSQSERIAGAVPGSKLVVFEKSGHMPFIEEQDAFIQTVRDFINA